MFSVIYADTVAKVTTSANTSMADEETPHDPNSETPASDKDGTGKILTESSKIQMESSKILMESSFSENSLSHEISMDSVPNVLPELCEFASLDFILQQLPRKAQRAQRAGPAIMVEFTCLDANKDFIVLGANFSMVFVYDRCENMFVKLRCEVSYILPELTFIRIFVLFFRLFLLKIFVAVLI